MVYVLHEAGVYRIKRGVKPYGGRLLYVDLRIDDRYGGKIKSARSRRWYHKDELESL